MIRLSLTRGLEIAVIVSLSPVLACQMLNPAFDLRENDSRADGTETAEGQDSDAELGDGDGDDESSDTKPETGDGDGEPTTTGDGDGDGEPTTGDGDGDGEPTTGDGDGDDGTSESTTGDGDGDPILLDMMAIELCPEIIGQDACQLCAADHCCSPGVGACFQNNTDCKCILDCMTEQQGDLMECAGACQAEDANIELVEQFAPCMQSNCNNFCG